MRILITDNDPAILDACTLIFERAGYDTTALDSPRTLLDGTAEVPDLYVLDKQLSGVDGIDVCRFLKSQPATAHLPVIIVSATPDMDRLAKEARADGFLEKPFLRADLLALVKECLSDKEE